MRTIPITPAKPSDLSALGCTGNCNQGRSCTCGAHLHTDRQLAAIEGSREELKKVVAQIKVVCLCLIVIEVLVAVVTGCRP